MARTYWRKVITAGPLREEIIYPAASGFDRPKVRAAKMKLSSRAQALLNKKTSWKKLERILAANFRPGDLVVCLTYDNQHLPKTRKEAIGRLKYFRQKYTAACRAEGLDAPVIVMSTEHVHGEGRWHHHLVINASTGDDYARVLAVWGRGEVEIKPLRVDKEKNYTTLAKYMAKEEREKVGLRSWSYTRNAKQPEIDVCRVEPEEEITLPPGFRILEQMNERNEYGFYKYVKAIAGEPVRHKVRARRRRGA